VQSAITSLIRNRRYNRAEMNSLMLAVLVVGIAVVCSCEKTPPPPPKDHDLTQYEKPEPEITGRLGGVAGRFHNCFDRHNYCGYWAARGFCYNSYYSSYMRRSCRRSCNSCYDAQPFPGGYNNHGLHGGQHNNFNNINNNGYNRYNRYSNNRRW